MILNVFYGYEGGRKCFQIPTALGWVFLYLCQSVYRSMTLFFFFFFGYQSVQKTPLAYFCDFTDYNNRDMDYGVMRSCRLISGLFFWKIHE